VAASSSATPSEILIDALATFVHGTDAAAHELADDLLATLRAGGGALLAQRLLDCAGDDADRRAHLVDFVGHAARVLAPDDDPPGDGAPASAWSALVAVANSLNGSGAYSLGRPRFIGDVLFRSLVEESHRELSSSEGFGASRATGQAGDALAALAVSRQLRESVSRALGFAVTPTYDALYEYDPPGSHVRTHVDSREYEIVFHLLLEHTSPEVNGGVSVLIAHLPSEPAPTRICLHVGEALVLRGRGTLHSWKALGGDEHRILTAIGFRRERD
jgi:hypothetical protein